MASSRGARIIAVVLGDYDAAIKRRHLLLSAPAALALAACGGDSEETLSLDHLSANGLGTVAAGKLVFRDGASWSSFWRAHPRPQLAPDPAPAVDFARLAGAGVFAGAKPSCSLLVIHAGRRAGHVVTLHWRIVTFGQSTPSSCLGNDFYSSNLADLVLIPASATEGVFVDETT